MNVQHLIIGAGPTGLGAAWRLEQRGLRDWLVLEAGDVAGGLAQSIVDEHGFTWDLGGHVQFSHYEMFDDLMDELLGRDGWLYHDRESWVWIRGRFVPYPFQLNLHRLPPSDTEQCVRGLEAAAAIASSTPPAHFGEWIERTFGGGIAELFMRPYNRKVWARDPEIMDWHWIGDRVAVADIARIRENVRLQRDDVSWGPNNRFRFPRRGGTGAVWQALAQRLTARDAPGAARIRFRTTVKHVDSAARRLALSDGSEITYGSLISTMPLDRLIAASDLARDLRAAARDLEYSSTHVIGVGLHGAPPAALAKKCWMYFPESDCPFYRVTHFSHYSPNNVTDPSTQWSLMAEVSESTHKPVNHARVVEEVVDGLLATSIIDSRAQVHHTWHMRLEHGYPIPSLRRDRALSGILSTLDARGVFSRGRFGAWKYEVSNQDHSFAQGVEAVDASIDGAEELTLRRPDEVNARRPAPARDRTVLMPTLLRYAKQLARDVQRDVWPSPERAVLQQFEREAARVPRYTHGEVAAGPYRVAYADAISAWPQWDDLFVREVMAFTAGTDAPRILDCGANVGIASMYFKHRYPKASITAFEADPALAEICRRNVASLPGPPVRVEAVAIWTHDGEVEFVREGSDSGAIASLDPSVAGARDVLSARRLRHWLNEPIDLLKIDIEGAELPVLRDCADLLCNVRAITIDVHEFDPARRQTGDLFDLLTKAGLVYDMIGLTSLPWRTSCLPSPFPGASPAWVVMVRGWRR